MKKKMSVSDKYASFMGSWMAGAVIGQTLGYIFVGWCLYKVLFSWGMLRYAIDLFTLGK